VGDWIIRVSDQETEEHNGTFHGWNMIFWGSTIDPSKAQKFEVPLIDSILPPIESTPRPTIPSATTSIQHTKPTSLLPGDHGTAEGENTKPAFSSIKEDVAAPTSSSTSISSTPDEGWFSDMSSLVTNQKWVFAAFGAVALFGVGAGAFFWRRRTRKSRSQYSALAGADDMSMSAVGGHQMTAATGGPRTTRELYDAFGEVSDDDDDELTTLQPPHARSTTGLGFHTGFLDDDDPSTAAGLTPKYRDQQEQPGEPSSINRVPSPNGSGGSWEHAS
jgi:kexin